MDVQAWFDAMGEAERLKRSRIQMTLGELIDALKLLRPETPISGLGKAISYRGYYSDLAFTHPEEDEREMSSELLERVESYVGATFTGYKGGDFVMALDTPLWLAEYGDTGNRIMGLELKSDCVKLITKMEE